MNQISKYRLYNSNLNKLIEVDGINDVKNYPLLPNSAIALFMRNGTSFFIKQSDQYGNTTIKAFEYNEIPLDE